MFGLTPLGTIHTIISLVALAAGAIALWQGREITSRTPAGVVFLLGTVLSCLTGFGIFQRGGFGNPHILGVITLVVLSGAFAAERAALLGGLSRYAATLGYSMAFFFHFIPGTVETLTRFPFGAPYLAGPDDPKAQPIVGVFFFLFLVGAALQVRRLRATRAARPA